MTDTGDTEPVLAALAQASEALERDHSEHERVKRFVRWLTVSVALDVALSLGLIFFGVAQHRSETDLCHATQRSWNTRARTADIITTPTKLSPEVERLFPADQIETLRLQIKSANALRAQQHAELVQANGPRPNC